MIEIEDVRRTLLAGLTWTLLAAAAVGIGYGAAWLKARATEVRHDAAAPARPYPPELLGPSVREAIERTGGDPSVVD